MDKYTRRGLRAYKRIVKVEKLILECEQEHDDFLAHMLRGMQSKLSRELFEAVRQDVEESQRNAHTELDSPVAYDRGMGKQ